MYEGLRNQTSELGEALREFGNSAARKNGRFPETLRSTEEVRHWSERWVWIKIKILQVDLIWGIVLILHNYHSNTISAVKIIHPATKEGFVSGTIFLDDEYAKDFTKENPQQFIDQFKKIVGSKDLIGDKTLIILSKESHHLFKQTTEKSRKKSLDVASKVYFFSFHISHQFI